MHVKTAFLLTILAVGLGLGTGCRSSSPSHPAYQPPWITNPKRADSVYFYVVGSASRQPSATAAREAAFQDALNRIADQIMNEVGISPASRAATRVTIPLEGAEILPDCVHIEPRFQSYDGYVQVGFPIAEKRKIIEEIRGR